MIRSLYGCLAIRLIVLDFVCIIRTYCLRVCRSLREERLANSQTWRKMIRTIAIGRMVTLDVNSTLPGTGRLEGAFASALHARNGTGRLIG